jgi:WD40 repeat protein
MNKKWITAGRDFKLREWDLDMRGGNYLIRELDYHKDEITDLVEIKNPNCIATCSLDKTIVMYDINQGEILRTINEFHTKGITHLRYQTQNGATMVSIATEIIANVWSPESLISDIHIGKLKGHRKAIVDGNYLNKAPFFVTIDMLNNMMIWDIKQMIVVQNLNSGMNFPVLGCLILSNNAFWVYNKRFFQCDTFSLEEKDKGQNNDLGIEENYPLSVHLNKYTFQQIVVTKSEVRMYDLLTGTLYTILPRVFRQEDDDVEISAFRIDKRHRKAYVSNNKGQIFVINSQNGVVVKNVT